MCVWEDIVPCNWHLYEGATRLLHDGLPCAAESVEAVPRGLALQG